MWHTCGCCIITLVDIICLIKQICDLISFRFIQNGDEAIAAHGVIIVCAIASSPGGIISY